MAAKMTAMAIASSATSNSRKGDIAYNIIYNGVVAAAMTYHL